MMRSMRCALTLRALPFVLVAIFATREAGAQIYKYKKADGTVVYTDNLGQLPPDRREHYNKLKEEQEQKRRDLERAIGREEMERRDAEAQKAALERASNEERDRAERLRLIDLQLQGMQKRRLERDAARDVWKKKMQDARALLDKRLTEFKTTQERYNTIAMKPSYTLLPGEAEELEKLKGALDRLEKEVDQSIEDVEINIPEAARLAGIPPGYLR